MHADKTILIIEDDVVQRRLMCRLTEKEGYKTLEANSGEEGMRILDEGTLPDLIVLDLQLPGLYGQEILEQIRTRYNQHELPILVLSGVSDPDEIVRTMKLGANDYLTKPCEFATILSRIKICLSISEKTRELLEIERRQVMEETLGAACHHVAQPITALQTELEIYLREVPQDNTGQRRKIEQMLRWARKSSEVVERMQKTHTYKTVRYTGKARMLDIPEPI